MNREGLGRSRALGAASMQSLYPAQSSPCCTRARDLLIRLVRPGAVWMPNAAVRLGCSLNTWGRLLFRPHILVNRRTSGEKVACHGSLQRPY